MLPRKILTAAIAVVCATQAPGSPNPESLDLAGEWRLALDAGDQGLAAGPESWSFDDSIQLPNTLTLAGKGEPLTRTAKLDKETLVNLHQRHSYVGPAWYQREIEIPASWQGMHVTVELERVLWESRIWINGTEAGQLDSLSTPHRHDISKWIKPGANTVTLRIDNREKLPIGIGHAYTNATQTIWNGVVGGIRLVAAPQVRIDSVRLRPSGKRMDATFGLVNATDKEVGADLEIQLTHPDGRKRPPIRIRKLLPAGDSRHEVQVDLGPDPALWGEFSPSLYQVDVRLVSESGESTWRESYGHRTFLAEGREFRINGGPVFLRGTLECCIFPRTGHPDMTGVEWEKICRTVKAYGLNHLRFHSWCPPRAAFEAADRAGIYLQIELPNWSFHMGQRPPVDEFFRAEGERILREFGNHPSFVILCLGNELTGDYGAMDRLVAHFRKLDPDKLFTSTAFSFSPRGKTAGQEDDFFISQETQSGWVRGQGFINQTPPNTTSDYSQGLSSVKVPLVTHEVGQYNNFPNLAELPKYEGGALRALGYEAIRDDLARKGRLEDAARLTRDSGKLAALLYKEDMERALRTPGLAGIQLLDLHDFPGQSTATVGILDAFWDSKGFITPEEFREFAGPVVPLARMTKFVWENTETFTADFELANFSKAPIQTSFTAQLIGEGGGPVGSRTFDLASYPLGNGHRIGRIDLPLDRVQAATKLELVITSKDGQIRNSWPVWVYPDKQPSPETFIHTSFGPATMEALAAGRKVLLLPERSSLQSPLDARFIPVFWSPLHFPDQPGTLGATIDATHPVFAGFPTDTHTNWQWWELFSTSFAMDLDGLTRKPVMPLCFVDKYNRNALPVAIWEAAVGKGKLMVCTLDLSKDIGKRPAARQLKRSITAYMASDAFNPSVAISQETLSSLFKSIRFDVSADSSSPRNPATNAVDGNPTTFWHTEWESGPRRLPATLTIRLAAPATIKAIDYAPRQDMNRGRVRDYRIETSLDGKTWHAAIPAASFPDRGDPERIVLPTPAKARFVRMVVLADHGESGHAAISTFEPVTDAGGDARGLGIVPGFNDVGN